MWKKMLGNYETRRIIQKKIMYQINNLLIGKMIKMLFKIRILNLRYYLLILM